MGCDIHLMIDYDTVSVPRNFGWLLSSERRRVVPFASNENVVSVSCGPIDIARNYRLFAALAGVRGGIESGPLIPPRGFPLCLSAATFNEFHLCIQERSDPALCERGIWRDEAEQLMASGKARQVIPVGRNAPWLTDPEFHTPSWLRRAEILAALNHHAFNPADLCVGFRIVLDALRVLEGEYGENHARIVFCFDN